MEDGPLPRQEEVPALEHVGVEMIEIPPIGLSYPQAFNPVNKRLVSKGIAP